MKDLTKDLLILLAGFIMLGFSGSALNVAMFVFLWPACLLWFLHRHQSLKALIPVWLVYCLVLAVHYGDSAGTGSLLTSGWFTFRYAIFAFLPFVADFFLYRHLPGALKVLLFPFAVAAGEFLIQLTHFSLMNNFGYALLGQELIQTVSVIGLYGLSGLIAAVSSVLVYVFENRENLKNALKPACILACILLVSSFYSGIRLYGDVKADTPTVRTALASGPELGFTEDGEWEVLSLEENIASMENSFAEAAQSGAKLICFCEEAFAIANYDEEAFVAEIRKLAAQYGMYANVPLEVDDFDGSMDGMSLNKCWFVDPEGNIMVNYTKSILVPVIETPYFIAGDGVIPSFEMNLEGQSVKSALSICYDGDFVQYTRTMPSDTAVWFNPSWEWQEVHKFHSGTIAVRAIENGVNLVKPTYEGLSVIADTRGRYLVCDSNLLNGVAVGDLPLTGEVTVYGQFGHILNALYTAGFALLAGFAVYRFAKNRKA